MTITFYRVLLDKLLYCFYFFCLYCFYCFSLKKHRMTSLHKIVVNVDIGMLLTCNFHKTFKIKFGSPKNRGKPKACRNFSILKEKFWQGNIYPPPWRIGLSVRIWLRFVTFQEAFAARFLVCLTILQHCEVKG